MSEETIRLELDGQEITVPKGANAARRGARGRRGDPRHLLSRGDLTQRTLPHLRGGCG